MRPLTLTPEAELELRARFASATRGPWRWCGNGGRKRREVHLYLATTHSGRIYIMDFVRSGWSGAQPRFHPQGMPMVDARDLLTYQVEYRDDISGINNPDARFLERSWEDVDALLKELDATREALRASQAQLALAQGPGA